MNDRKIERRDGRGFGQQQLPADSNGNSISNEKNNMSSRPDIYKAF